MKRRLFSTVDDAHGNRERRLESEQQLSKGRIGLVVHHEVCFFHALVVKGHGFKLQGFRIELQTLVAFLAEDERLIVFHLDLCIRSSLFVHHILEDVFVIHDAVLQNLNERRAVVVLGGVQHGRQAFLVHVHRTSDKRRAGAHRKKPWLNGAVHRSAWARRAGGADTRGW